MRSRLVTALVGLILVAGGCATNTAPTSTTNPAPLVALELTVEGLGDVLFGLDPATVLADISAQYGEPDFDSGWIPAEPNIFGTCPGETMRAIGWGSLVAIFIDDGTSDLGGWFYTYTYGYDYAENTGGVDTRGFDLETAGGIGLGSTVAELEEVFGGDLEVTGDATLDVWVFTAPRAGFRGLLSGGEATDSVTLIEPIDGCD
ncbi:MAG: hypothetical protein QNJ81_08485 [Acidimicrobiia bacterium]|nr:hypothetical protein [Acidimicrobiia bacterium]